MSTPIQDIKEQIAVPITDVSQHLTKFDHLINTYALPFAWKILGAFVLWAIGGLCIRFLKGLLLTGLRRKQVDPTLVQYTEKTVGVLLRIFLLIAILGVFGIETTSFSAILAAAGVAVGIAWSGLLSNFAAGIFLILFRPFRVGDVILAAGVSGTVQEVGIFATTVDTGDNLRIFVGNNKIFSDNILNYSTNKYRLATFKVQIASQVDPFEAMEKLKACIEKIPGVLPAPGVTAEITEFNTLGILLSIKAPCHNSQFPSVTTLGNSAIYQTIKSANYPHPESKMVLIQN